MNISIKSAFKIYISMYVILYIMGRLVIRSDIQHFSGVNIAAIHSNLHYCE